MHAVRKGEAKGRAAKSCAGLAVAIFAMSGGVAADAAGGAPAAGSRVAGRVAPAPQVSPSTTPAFNQDAPDPDVVRAGGTFYAYTTGTTWGNHIGVLRSQSPTSGWATLTGKTFGSTAIGPLPSWEANNTQTSPGVFAWGGRWVMFYDAIDSANGQYCISVATSGSPAGPFEDTSSGPLVCQVSLGGSVDPSPFVDASGHPWLYWKSNGGSSSLPAELWAAPLDASGTVPASNAVSVMKEDTVNYPWETTIENPDMVLIGGTYYLFFAGGKWDSPGYAEGYAVCDGPQGPCRQPSNQPLLSSYGSVAGPGAGGVFTDASGQAYLAYDAWSAGCTSYSCGGARRLYVAPLGFSSANCAAPQGPQGYRFVAADGGVFDFGNLPYCGSGAGAGLNGPVSGSAPTADEGGYWIVTTSGQVTAFGDASFFGDVSSLRLAAPVVGIAPTPDGRGYWLAASDGGVFAFGDAGALGSMGGKPLAAPVVGMTADRSTGGYWLVASDGGIFAFGSPFFGSTGGMTLNRPIVALVPTRDARGYWLVASDGGIFSYGDARFFGSTGSLRLNQPVVAMEATPDGGGYRLVASDGGVFDFGDASFLGSTGSIRLAQPIVGIAG
jgi:hypothetical protein